MGCPLFGASTSEGTGMMLGFVRELGIRIEAGRRAIERVGLVSFAVMGTALAV